MRTGRTLTDDGNVNGKFRAYRLKQAVRDGEKVDELADRFLVPKAWVVERLALLASRQRPAA